MKRAGCGRGRSGIRDLGPWPQTVNLNCCARRNENYRTALWTGNNLQVTLMSIPAQGEIGAEIHPGLDQLICIVEGCGLAVMQNPRTSRSCRHQVTAGSAVIVPAGTRHNIINAGSTPLKLYSVYAPPQHPFGTIQRTAEEAEDSEEEKSGQ